VNQLGFDFNFAQGKNSFDNASNPARTRGDKWSNQDAAGTGPKFDSGRNESQVMDIFSLSLKSSASARYISANDNRKARLDSAP
jgi:hypothetical protein